METVTRTRTVHEDGPLAVKTNVSSTAFYDRLLNNRDLLVRVGAAALVVVLLIAAVVMIGVHRGTVANAMLSDAMRTFDTPLSTPDQPLPPDTKSFASSEERARAANAQFAAVADKYGMTTAGRNAQYLQGVTALQMGQTATAETLLKKSADDWNHDVATLAEMSLAGLYRTTGRESQAADLYNKVAAKPSALVPAGLAQLQMAEMYEASGKTAEAKKIYAQIKDKDAKSAAADIAAQKLAAPTR